MLQKGFLHRNINIYNTLLLDTPVTMRPFDARSIGQLTLQNGPGDQFNEHVERLEDCIRKLGFSDKCNGFVIDDGVVASLEKDSPLHGPVEKFVSTFDGAGNLTDNCNVGGIRVHVRADVAPAAVPTPSPPLAG